MIKRNTVVALALLLISQVSVALQEISPLPARLKNKTLSVSKVSKGVSDSEAIIYDSSGVKLGSIYCDHSTQGYSYIKDIKENTFGFSDYQKCWKVRGFLEKYSGDKDITIKIQLDLEEDKVTRIEVIDSRDQAKAEKIPDQVTK